MKKILIALLLGSPLLASAQDSIKVDTVKAELRITNSKLNGLQSVAGHVILKNGCVVGYLSRNRKQFPKKVTVWSHYY
jgi:hypothetical protein